MTDSQKALLVSLLEVYHREQKEQAQGLVELKVCEEAAEVILADLKGEDTGPEEADLLMCLVVKEDQHSYSRVAAWESRMQQRRRELFPAQAAFLDYTAS